MIRLILRTFIFSFLTCFVAYSNDDVEYVYRIDDRRPEDIFTSGFSSWGSNTDVEAHLRGTTCVAHSSTPERSGTAMTSAYIATSLTQDRALSIASVLHTLNPNTRYYLYRIRADQNFYSAQLSANRLQIVDPLLLAMVGVQREYMALSSIPANHIENSRNITWATDNNGYPNISDPRPNPHYNSTLHTVANRGAAPATVRRSRFADIWTMTSSMISSCFLPCSNNRQRRDIITPLTCAQEVMNIRYSTRAALPSYLSPLLLAD